MTFNGWIQIALYSALVISAREAARRLHDARLRRRAHLAVAGAAAGRARHLPAERRRRARASSIGSAYAVAMLLFSLVGFVMLYALQRLQDVLPFNPQGLRRSSRTSPSTRR